MAGMLTVTLSDLLGASCPNLRLGVVIGSVVGNGEGSAPVTAALDEIVARLQTEADPLAHPRLTAMADTFRRAGMNPGRYAPASVALVKRVATGKAMYRINDLVDTNTAISLALRLPLGIYDRDHIVGTRLTYDLGAPQATYVGIDGVEQRTTGKLLLTDRDRVIGGPHADAAPTRITVDTRHFLCVIYAPDAPEAPGQLPQDLAVAERTFRDLCHATILATSIVG